MFKRFCRELRNLTESVPVELREGEDFILLHDGPEGTLVRPKTAKAATHFGNGNRRWPVSTPDILDNFFDVYNRRAPVYIWIVNDDERYMFWLDCSGMVPKPVFLDAVGKPITGEKMHELRYETPPLRSMFEEFEDCVSDSTTKALEYAMKAMKGPWPEGEDVIRKTPLSAFDYAVDVLNDRWPEGEDVIRTDHILWTSYVDFLKDIGRAEELEQAG